VQPKTSTVNEPRKMHLSSSYFYVTAPIRTAHLAQQTTRLGVFALQRHYMISCNTSCRQSAYLHFEPVWSLVPVKTVVTRYVAISAKELSGLTLSRSRDLSLGTSTDALKNSNRTDSGIWEVRIGIRTTDGGIGELRLRRRTCGKVSRGVSSKA
jgi:hypothetical protein